MYWRLALSLTTREQRELGIKLRSAVISSEWDQYPHVLAAAFILSVFIRVAKRSPVIFPAARVQGRLRKACQHVMSHVFAVFSYPAAFLLRHYLIVFHEDEFLPEHLLPWVQLAMLGLSAKVR